jgi:HSP20 family protein
VETAPKPGRKGGFIMARKVGKELKKVQPQGPWLSPLEEMERRFEDMENWMEEFFGQPFWKPMRRHARTRFPRFREATPTVDVFEDKNDLVIKAEVPGIEKGDLDVQISENVITISGEKKTEEKLEEKDYYFRECSTGSFRRQIPLPEGTEGEKARAVFKDGILEIRIPKSEEVKEKTRSIPIH